MPTLESKRSGQKNGSEVYLGTFYRGPLLLPGPRNAVYWSRRPAGRGEPPRGMGGGGGAVGGGEVSATPLPPCTRSSAAGELQGCNCMQQLWSRGGVACRRRGVQSQGQQRGEMSGETLCRSSHGAIPFVSSFNLQQITSSQNIGLVVSRTGRIIFNVNKMRMDVNFEVF